jgi:hypothetical protein
MAVSAVDAGEVLVGRTGRGNPGRRVVAQVYLPRGVSVGLALQGHGWRSDG